MNAPTVCRFSRRGARQAAAGSIDEFVRHVIESWVLAQHAYWSVGRGLGDARAGGKVLLRLKIILDVVVGPSLPGHPLAYLHNRPRTVSQRP